MPKDGAGAGVLGEAAVASKLEAFGRQCRATMSRGLGTSTPELEDSIESAIEFVGALCRGVAPFAVGMDIAQDGSMVFRPRVPLRGEFATKSRIPFQLQCFPAGVSVRVSPRSPDHSCPFRCPCHARCFGPASGGEGPWAELIVKTAKNVVYTLAASVQVFPADLAALAGRKLVLVPGNDLRSVDVKGEIAVLTEKDKGGNTSDGFLSREAMRAGAVGVVKIGGDGRPCRVPDPMAIVCIQLSGPPARSLESYLDEAADAGQPLVVVEVRETDCRNQLERERWGRPAVWVHMKGLRLRTLDCSDSAEPLYKKVNTWRSAAGPLVYEDFAEYFWDSGSTFAPASSKVSRMIHSAIKQLERAKLARNPAQFGKLLAISYQQWEAELTYVRFQPGRQQKGVTCAMLWNSPKPFGDVPRGDAAPPTPEVTWAWMAHESVFLVCLGAFGKLIGFIAPSLWNFVKCCNADFFGWECDATKIIKLFTPATGPVGPEPKEAWQRDDPTWRITDETRLGVVTRAQGRILWTEARAGADSPVSDKGARAATRAVAMARGGCMTGLLSCWQR